MAFDPDKYLAQKTNTAFDPDKYLAKQSGASTSTQGKDPSMLDEAGEWIGDRVRNLGTTAESGLQSGLNMLSFGHAPEIQAQYGRGMEALTGSEVTPYGELRDYFRNRADKKFEQAPVAGFMGGAVGLGAQIAAMGGGAVTKVPGLVQAAAKGGGREFVKGLVKAPVIGAASKTGAKEVAKGLAKSGAIGAGFGASINPEHAPDGLGENLKARAEQAAWGVPLGVGGDLLIRGAAKAWPYWAKLSSGAPTQSSKTYSERAPEVDALIDKKYGYTDKIKEIHGKIKGAADEQEVLALGEFTQEIAQKRPTTIGPEKIEGRVNNIQAKLDESKLVQETAFAEKQAAHQAQLEETANSMAVQREQAAKGYVSNERARLNDSLKGKLGSDDIDAAMVERMNQKTEELKQAFYAKKREVGAKIQEGVVKSGEPINISTVFDPIDAEIARLSNSGLAETPAVAAEIESLVQMRESISKGLGGTLDAESAFLLKDRLKLMSSAQNMQQAGMGSRFGGADSAIDKAMKDASLKAYQNLNKELDRVANATGHRKEYAKLAEFEKVLDNQFSSPEKMLKSLTNAGGSKKLFIRDSTKKIKDLTDGKVDLADDFALINDYHTSFLPDEKLIPRQLNNQIDNFYAGQQSQIQSGLKQQFQAEAEPMLQSKRVYDRNFSTPEKTQKTLMQSQQEGAHSSKKAVNEMSVATGEDLNAQAQDVYNYKYIEDQIQNFKKNPVPVGPYSQKYMETKKIIDQGFKTPEKTFTTLSGYDKFNQKFQKQNVDEISQVTGQNLQKDAELLQSYRWYEDPGLLPVSSEGVTSTSMGQASAGIFEKAGSMVGEKTAHAGRTLGRVLGGPWAVKKGIKAKRWLSPMLPAQQNAPILYTPWMGVDDRDKRNGR